MLKVINVVVKDLKINKIIYIPKISFLKYSAVIGKFHENLVFNLTFYLKE